MKIRGRYAKSKYSRREAKQKREVANFTGNLSRLGELLENVTDIQAFDDMLAKMDDMEPEVKSEVRKLVQNMLEMRDVAARQNQPSR